MSQRSPLTKKSEAPVRNRIFPAISGNKDVTIISDCSPKETQEGEYLPSSSPQGEGNGTPLQYSRSEERRVGKEC